MLPKATAGNENENVSSSFHRLAPVQINMTKTLKTKNERSQESPISRTQSSVILIQIR